MAVTKARTLTGLVTMFVSTDYGRTWTGKIIRDGGTREHRFELDGAMLPPGTTSLAGRQVTIAGHHEFRDVFGPAGRTLNVRTLVVTRLSLNTGGEDDDRG